MTKKIFIVSGLGLNEKSKHYEVSDNYIKINNPDFIIKENKILRETEKDWEYDGTYIDKKCNMYFNLISKRLNNLHSVDYDEKYWKQVFYLGFKRYIALVYEFFKQIEERFDVNSHDACILKEELFYTPDDLEDLRVYLSNSEFAQEQLFSIYCNVFNKEINYRKISYENNHIKNSSKKVISSFQNKIKWYLYSSLKVFQPKVLLIGVYFDKSNTISLIKKSWFNIFIVPFKPHTSDLKALEDKKRKKLFSSENYFDKFDKFFFKACETLFPTCFIEDFLDITRYYNNDVEKYNRVKYVISESWISDNQMSFFIAHLRKNGVLFIYNEHRGLQHPFINNFVHDLSEIADYYYTQGWKPITSLSNIIPCGSLHPGIKKKENSILPITDNILYMTAPAYVKRTNYNGINFFAGEDSKCYFNFQIDFFSNLNEIILKKIIYRNAPIINNRNFLIYNPEYILGKYMKKMQQKKSKLTGLEAMNNSKLVIIDYLGTGYLEALLNNIPTVLFLNNNSYLDNKFKEIFTELQSVGIMQTNGKKAAEFIQIIESNPLEWWLKNDVQKAKNNFISSVIGKGELLEFMILSLIKD